MVCIATALIAAGLVRKNREDVMKGIEGKIMV